MSDFTHDMGQFWKTITGDSQLRWLGPEKGVIHLATGALVNAVWDLYGKLEQKPLWELISKMTPEQLVKCIDFTYITDAITEKEALDSKRKEIGKEERINYLLKNGYQLIQLQLGGWVIQMKK